MEAMIQHEKGSSTQKNPDAMMQRLINARYGGNGESTAPYSDAVLQSEAEVTIWGGIIDLSNILPLGTFMVSQNPELQTSLHEELKAAWPDSRTPVPAYEVLRHLPILVRVEFLTIMLIDDLFTNHIMHERTGL